MLYLAGFLWLYQLIALGLGVFFGWWAASSTRLIHRPFLLAGAAVLVVGALIAYLQVARGQSGLWWDIWMMLFLAYVVGCLIAWLLRSVIAKPDISAPSPAPKPVPQAATTSTPAKPAEPVSPPSAAMPSGTGAAMGGDKPQAFVAAPTVATAPLNPAEKASTSAAPVEMSAASLVTASDEFDDADESIVASRPPGLSAPEGGNKDDLKRISGIGRVNEGRLNELGIFHFAQIASWTVEHAKWVNSHLSFPGRIQREKWISQAKLLASGGDTEFSKRVKSGKVPTSSD